MIDAIRSTLAVFWLGLALAFAIRESQAESSFTPFDSPAIERVRFGLSGSWKLGYLSQALVTVVGGADGFRGQLEIETVDADGVLVIYQAEGEVPPNRSETLSMIVAHGRANRPIRVRLVDQQGNERSSRTVTEEERGEILPVSQPWVVGIGSEMNLEQAALRSARGMHPSYSTSEIADASLLPRRAEGYQGVDLLVLSTRDPTRLESLSADQQQALVEWVHRGGHVLLWLGQNAQRAQQLPWLDTLIGAKLERIVSKVDPALLESYLQSQKRIPSITCAFFQPSHEVIDLSLQLLDRKKLPFLMRKAVGLGQVHLCATELDASPLREWPERKLLLEKIYAEHFQPIREASSTSGESTNYIGYFDLSGQVHAALDRFDQVTVGSLTAVASLLLAIVALLVGFDYFVLARSWRMPGWTWLSLFVWSLLAMGGISWLAMVWKPEGLAVNSIELLDFDYASNRIRGRCLAHCYSGRAGQWDVTARARHFLSESQSSDVTRSIEQAAVPLRLSWSGQPGYGMGGFESEVRTDVGFPSYRVIERDRDRDIAGPFADPSRHRAVELKQVGIPFAGSKAIDAIWLADGPEQHHSASFTLTPGSELLQGTWTNPMSEDLLDGWLLYRNGLYLLPSRIRAYGSYQIPAAEIPKDLGRRLQRRQFVQDRDSSQPWDPTDRTDLGRLVEMLCLYQAAGGQGYTGLSHDYWRELDLSKHLKLNRAIIFGRLAKPMVDFAVSNEASDAPIQNRHRVAFVRFIVPVTMAN